MSSYSLEVAFGGPVVYTAAAVLVSGLLFLLLRPDSERAVAFHVPAPPQCRSGWKGEVLEELSVKVGSIYLHMLDERGGWSRR